MGIYGALNHDLLCDSPESYSGAEPRTIHETSDEAHDIIPGDQPNQDRQRGTPPSVEL